MITLINDDCLKAMDKLIIDGVVVDAIITDPPYGMNYYRHIPSRIHNKIKNDENELSNVDFNEILGIKKLSLKK